MLKTKLKKKALVLCHYDEDLTWTTNKEFLNFKIYIYDKAKRIQDFFIAKSTVTRLPDVGTNIQTYMYHIVNQYDTLDDLTFFSQGHPFDHCPCFLEMVKKQGQYIECSEPILTCDGEGLPHHPGLKIKELYEHLFETPFPGSIDFMASTIYGVSKEIVLRRPKELYQKALTCLETQFLAPWEMERMLRHMWMPTN